MKNLLLLFSVFFTLHALAQSDTSKIIGIHTAVGKSISQEEKIKYNLFPEYKDSLFESAEIMKVNDSTYEVVVHTKKATDIKSYISTQDLDEMYFRIDDVNKADKDHLTKFEPSEEEKKKMRRQQARAATGTVFLEVLGEIFLASLQVFLTVALSR